MNFFERLLFPQATTPELSLQKTPLGAEPSIYETAIPSLPAHGAADFSVTPLPLSGAYRPSSRPDFGTGMTLTRDQDTSARETAKQVSEEAMFEALRTHGYHCL